MFVAGGFLSLNILPTERHGVSWIGNRSGPVTLYFDQNTSYGWPVVVAQVTPHESRFEGNYSLDEIEEIENIYPNSFLDGSFSGSARLDVFLAFAPTVARRFDFKIERDPDEFYTIPIIVNLVVALLVLALATVVFEWYMRPFYNSVRRRRKVRQ